MASLASEATGARLPLKASVADDRGTTRIAIAALILLVVWPKFFSVPGLGVSPYTACMFFLVIATATTIAQSALRSSKLSQIVNLNPGIISLGLIYILWQIFSTYFGGDASSILGWIRSFFAEEGVFLVGLCMSTDDNRLSVALKTLIALLTFNFLIAICEYAVGVNLFFAAAIILHLPIDPSVFGGVGSMREGALRATSLFSHPIVLGIVSATSIPVFHAFGLRAPTKNARVWWWCCIPIAALASVASGSRSATVTGFVACGIYVLTLVVRASRRRRAHLTIFAAIAVSIFFPLASSKLIDMQRGRTSNEVQSSGMREQNWQKADPYIKLSPVVGWGYGSSFAYASIGGRWRSATIDDSYLTIILDYGFGGLALFSSLIFLFFCRSTLFAIKADDSASATLAAALSSAALGIAFGQKGNSQPYAFGFLYLYLGLFVGMSTIHRQNILKRTVTLDTAGAATGA